MVILNVRISGVPWTIIHHTCQNNAGDRNIYYFAENSFLFIHEYGDKSLYPFVKGYAFFYNADFIQPTICVKTLQNILSKISSNLEKNLLYKDFMFFHNNPNRENGPTFLNNLKFGQFLLFFILYLSLDSIYSVKNWLIFLIFLNKLYLPTILLSQK